MSSVPRIGLIGLAATLLIGCATQREVSLPVVYGARVNVDAPAPLTPRGDPAEQPEGPQDEAHWRPVADDFGAGAPQLPPAPSPNPASTPRMRLAARAAASRSLRPIAPVPTLAVPRKRAAKAARPEGKKTGKSTAQLASDHYLDYPTHIKAQKITFACPKAYSSRVRLYADDLDRSRPGRVKGQGNARLLIGELTLEAERITWRLQAEGKQDVQVLARGEVQMVSEVRGNVHRETGIRGLVITNDQLVPLR